MIVRAKQQRSVHPILYHHYDQKFLTIILAQKDPLLRQLSSIASFVLDDHPYPKTREQFVRRTREINKNIEHLHLSSSDQKFLDRLMMETGVSVVRIFVLYIEMKNSFV